jgi:hypothetical protein
MNHNNQIFYLVTVMFRCKCDAQISSKNNIKPKNYIGKQSQDSKATLMTRAYKVLFVPEEHYSIIRVSERSMVNVVFYLPLHI